eukprot:g71928.t1
MSYLVQNKLVLTSDHHAPQQKKRKMADARCKIWFKTGFHLFPVNQQQRTREQIEVTGPDPLLSQQGLSEENRTRREQQQQPKLPPDISVNYINDTKYDP